MQRRVRHILAITLLLLANVAICFAATFPDRLEILSLLEKRDFKALNDLIAHLEDETSVHFAFGTFHVVNPALGPLLDEWVQAFPNAYQSHLARAEYLERAAFHRRGSKWSNETPKEQMDAMKALLPKADADAEAALSSNRKLADAYAVLIASAMAVGDHPRALDLTERGLSALPDSFYVRRAYMEASEPRWGGSYEEMRRFAQAAKSHESRNPKLAVLAGLVAMDQGRVFLEDKNYGAALTAFTQALSEGEYAQFYQKLTNVYRWRKEYDKALAAANRALELYPQDPDGLADRASVLSALDRIPDALKDIELASRLDPDEESLKSPREWLASKLVHNAYELGRAGKYDDALSAYNQAISLNSQNKEAYYWRGRTLIDKGNLKAAEDDLRKAVALDPHYIEAMRSLDWVLGKDNRWDEIAVLWTKFIASDPKNANAYLERAGTYHHKGDREASLADLKTACDLGNGNACQIHAKETGH